MLSIEKLHSRLMLAAGTVSVCALAHPVWADVKPASVFSDNVVLQRRQLIPVFGTADAGEKVTVKLGTAQAETTTDAAGNWRANLPAREAGTNLELTVQGKNLVAYKNVAVGEVWVCSGQSNMEWAVRSAKDAEAETAAANYPDIRLLIVRNATSITPKTEIKGDWQVCSPQTIGGFSAVGYYFGRELYQKLNVPVGLISSDWGGTPAQAWTSREALDADPALKPLLENWEKKSASYTVDLEKYQKETLPAWEAAVAQAKAEGKPEPRKPGAPNAPDSHYWPTTLYNAMINPLIPFGIKGAIWYQGESNSGQAVQYRTLFPTMIKDWRTRWGQGDFPFLWVQLANYQDVQKAAVEEGREGWPMLREAQDRTLSLPRTGMATAIDLADADNPRDIHPRNKQDVGKRLALIALNNEYNVPTPHSGPRYTGIKVEGNKIRLSFDHAQGLQAKGDALKGFAIADAQGPWQWADATIEGNTVVVSSAAVANPTRVRYAWAINPIGNLYNAAGLPAYPFRTDVDSAQ